MIHERDRELSVLRGLLSDLDPHGGRVVLVRGEAGIGKSTLITAFLDQIGGAAHVLIGGCDDLLTAQPLGPIWDIARREPSVASRLEAGDRVGVREALLELCARGLRPTVFVIEDTQWADDATLDVVKFLGRRAARLNAILILTYRDGEVDADHPLRRVLGELPAEFLVRLTLEPLSERAVTKMVGGHDLDVSQVLALTGGNPLFVTEILAAGVESVPATVRDAVLARTAKLSEGARQVLALVSVIPGGIDLGVIEPIVSDHQDGLDECVRRGLLEVTDTGVSYRHELQRRAVESSVSVFEVRSLNQQVLGALEATGDLARLVHHAREAGDVDAILRFGPSAARSAMQIESYAEALAHFRTVAPHVHRLNLGDQADVMGDWSRVAFFLDDQAASDLLAQAIELRRRAGDDLELARLLVFAVRVSELTGRPDLADANAAEAVDILRHRPPSHRLASALNQLAWLQLVKGDDHEAALDSADEAIGVAELVGDEQNIVRALIVKGAIGHASSERTSVSFLEEGYARAVAAGYRLEEVYALVNLAGLAADVRQVERAADFAQRARAAAARYELRYLEMQTAAMHAEILLWKGEWDRAENVATEVLGSNPHAELIAWRVLASLQTRRGSPSAETTLRHMWELATASEALQNLDPAAGTMAEYLWLVDDQDAAIVAELSSLLARAIQIGFLFPSGAFAFWMWKLGRLPTIPDDLSDFYRWIIEGDWERAAQFWESAGVPYERALALMHGPVDAQLDALRIFEDLGAEAMAARLRRQLTSLGVRVPRGTGRTTRSHGAGLTGRQAEVLELLAEGMTNGEIADRLFLSPRTVENHVSAVLMKLEAASRSDAVRAAVDRGLLASHDQN